MNKKHETKIAEVRFISEPQYFRRNKKPDFTKVQIDLMTPDMQVFYAEVRNSNIRQLNNIFVGDIVEVDYIFAGSEKDGKKYNNIYVLNIRKL